MIDSPDLNDDIEAPLCRECGDYHRGVCSSDSCVIALRQIMEIATRGGSTIERLNEIFGIAQRAVQPDSAL